MPTSLRSKCMLDAADIDRRPEAAHVLHEDSVVVDVQQLDRACARIGGQRGTVRNRSLTVTSMTTGEVDRDFGCVSAVAVLELSGRRGWDWTTRSPVPSMRMPTSLSAASTAKSRSWMCCGCGDGDDGVEMCHPRCHREGAWRAACWPAVWRRMGWSLSVRAGRWARQVGCDSRSRE